MIRNKRYSYAASWEAYVQGNTVSITSPRYIRNILAATAATETEDSEDSSDDTDAEQYENFDFKAGSMALVQQTLKGMSANNLDEGMKAMGRHAKTIRLGRSLWESAPLEPSITSLMQERFFDGGTFPPLKEVKTAAAQAQIRWRKGQHPSQGRLCPQAASPRQAMVIVSPPGCEELKRRKNHQPVNKCPFSIGSRIVCFKNFNWKKKGCCFTKQTQNGPNVSNRSWASATDHLEQAKAR